MNSNILYDGENDNLYVLIYRLGKGACATVWFAVEFAKFMSSIKNRKLNVLYKALKIHNSGDFDEGMLETKINELLPKTEQDSIYINYPVSHFIHDDNIVIVVYEVAIGSLYDISKMYDKNLPSEFVNKIIFQMSRSIQFLHKNNYIHTDIKPENFLLVGISKYQHDIVQFVKKYDLFSKFKLTKKKTINVKNMIEIIHDPIYQMLNDLSVEFDIFDGLVQSDENSDDDNENDSDDDNDNEENENEENEDEENEDNEENEEENSEDDNENEEENKDESVKSQTEETVYESDISSKADTDLSSYDSNKKEYFYKYDRFNIDKISKIKNREDFSTEKENSLIKNKIEENKKFIRIYIENPKILLTDFGLLQKKNTVTRTVQTRYYRSPEIVLGLKYDEMIDLWALGCSLYELLTGTIMINVVKSEYSLKYDKDLINIKLLIEKIENVGYENIKNMCDLSTRKEYIFNDDYTLKYFKDLTYDNWKNNQVMSKSDIKIINFIDNLLKINPKHRLITIN